MDGGSRLGWKSVHQPGAGGEYPYAINGYDRNWRVAARTTLRGAISHLLKLVGFDLIRLYRLPRTTFLGLSRFPINTIVDVGANRGQFAQDALAFFPRAQVISFEPQPFAFKVLEQLAATRGGRITPVNLALGDSEGVAR